jgi:hypothetical protein
VSSENANRVPPIQPGPPNGKEAGTGEGSDTALRALIRKRRMAQTPDEPTPPPPPPKQPSV